MGMIGNRKSKIAYWILNHLNSDNELKYSYRQKNGRFLPDRGQDRPYFKSRGLSAQIRQRSDCQSGRHLQGVSRIPDDRAG